MYVCMYLKNFACDHANWICETCGRVLLSKTGNVNHMKSDIDRQSSSNVPQRPDSTVCVICGKVCRSSSGLKRYMVVHKDSISHEDPINSVKTLTFVCHVCHRPCKSAGGIQSHLRTHEGLFDAEHETWDGNHQWRCCNHQVCMYVCINRIWHQIIYKGWYAIKPNQLTNQLNWSGEEGGQRHRKISKTTPQLPKKNYQLWMAVTTWSTK